MYGESDGWPREKFVADEIQLMDDKKLTRMVEELRDNMLGQQLRSSANLKQALEKWAKKHAEGY